MQKLRKAIGDKLIEGTHALISAMGCTLAGDMSATEARAARELIATALDAPVIDVTRVTAWTEHQH
eukprot:COSAG01_NODE_47251_length_392_cov_0.863481_1_plen_65_part_10